MRILVNRGGQQLGPFSLDELRAALGSGQISLQDLAWWEGAPAWVPVAQVPVLNVAGPGFPSTPVSSENPASGLATTSLILGILSLFGLSCLAGIPAVICGHMALARQKRAGYKGSGVAIAGLVTGYAGTVLITLIALLAAIAVPGFMRARERAMLMKSMSNAREIAVACQMYQANHNGEFPTSLDALGEFEPSTVVLTDPLAQGRGPNGYWYSQPSRNASPDTVVVVSRGKTSDGKRALGHKDGSASIGPFTLPTER
jgi:type II secretory pathway pseudopilin PulG